MKKLNKLGQLALFAVLVVALSMTACKANVGTPSVAVTGVTLDKTTAKVEVDKTVTLKATISPSDATNKAVTWTSDKTDIAKVDAKGVVTGVKAGTAKITVTTKDGGKTASCTVTVKTATTPTPSVAVTGVTLDKTTAEVEVDKTVTLKATVAPANATNKGVTWTSDKTDIATVTDGVVTGVKAGIAKITVTTKDGGKTASCTVTVKTATTPTPSIAVTSVTLDKTTAEVEVDKTVTLKATVLPANATNKYLTWTSDKTDIATVDTNGVVTGVKAGIAKITVTTKDGGKTASCTVTVKTATTPTIPEGFVPVNPPTDGIVGEVGTPVGSGDYYKGVFIKDRIVKLTPYAIAEEEVTYKLWNEVYRWAKENGYTFANKGRCGHDGISDGSVVSDGSENEPVTTVSWRDCIVWCNAYTEMKTGNTDNCVYTYKGAVLKSAIEKDGDNYKADKCVADMDKKGFRLPTEAEWEYAARYKKDNTLTALNFLSGATADYNNAEACKAVAWYSANSEGKTHECGTRQLNALGLYDMSGNVREWCFDWCGTVETGEVQDPQGSASGLSREYRGGGWGNDARHCVVGYRNNGTPDFSYFNLGFRLAWRP